MPKVKEQAIAEIESETNLERWREESDKETVTERKKVLDELLKKIKFAAAPSKKFSISYY
ncbi:MAG: hypothetical protein LBM93_07980 [Oscillospiraceae bacterium]|jgi:hypothetical protein|nr:hypothetical protein [Oscillospiraceae bacterium]